MVGPDEDAADIVTIQVRPSDSGPAASRMVNRETLGGVMLMQVLSKNDLHLVVRVCPIDVVL